MTTIGAHGIGGADAMCDAIVAVVLEHTIGRTAGDDLTVVAAHVQ